MLLLCAKALCCTTFRVECILLAVSGSCPLSCPSWQLPSSFRRPGASQPHFHLSSAPFHFTFSFFLSGMGYSVYKFQNPIAQKMSNNSRQQTMSACWMLSSYPSSFSFSLPQSCFDSLPRENHPSPPAVSNPWAFTHILWKILPHCDTKLRLTMEWGRST